MLFYVLLHTVELLPLVAFWSLLYFGREGLYGRTIGIFVALWAGSLLFIYWMDYPREAFAAVEALLDVVLVLLVFGGDFKIR